MAAADDPYLEEEEDEEEEEEGTAEDNPNLEKEILINFYTVRLRRFGKSDIATDVAKKQGSGGGLPKKYEKLYEDLHRIADKLDRDPEFKNFVEKSKAVVKESKDMDSYFNKIVREENCWW